MPKPLIFTSISKAGGASKTTLAVNLAYEWSLRGYSVGIIDLDSNHSIEEFVGIAPENDPAFTSLALFDPKFKGEYNFHQILGSNKVFLLQGHDEIEHLADSLYSRKLREFSLRKILQKYPLNFDLLIFDLPGGYDLITDNVLSVCTHLLIPVHIGVKTLSVSKLIDRVFQGFEELELNPEPKIIGLIPTKYDTSSSTHREVYAALQEIAISLDFKCYPPQRYWRNFERAAMQGKALKQLVSNDPMGQVFAAVIDDLVKDFQLIS